MRRAHALQSLSPQRYPRWIWYPRSAEPPAWVHELVAIFTPWREAIDSEVVHVKSDGVLEILKADLLASGFAVEGGDPEMRTLRRPVHFGEFGESDIEYQIDAYHSAWRLGLEIEAGRTIANNAVYKDLVQSSLLVGLDYFALAVPTRYTNLSSGREVVMPSYEKCRSILDAIYSSERLRLPLKGVLLIGY